MRINPRTLQKNSPSAGQYLVKPKHGVVAFLLAFLMSATQVFALDVNKASLDELQTVEGVGPVIAKRILDERRSGGRFASTEDLISRVKGVGDKTAQRITSGSGLKKGSKATRSTSSKSSSRTSSAAKTSSSSSKSTSSSSTAKKSDLKSSKKDAKKGSKKKTSAQSAKKSTSSSSSPKANTKSPKKTAKKSTKKKSTKKKSATKSKKKKSKTKKKSS